MSEELYKVFRLNMHLLTFEFMAQLAYLESPQKLVPTKNIIHDLQFAHYVLNDQLTGILYTA